MENAIGILDHLQFDCPTTEQKKALLALSDFVKVSNNDDFYILCGSAGTGKTSMTTALIGHLNSKAISYLIAAPTGRAARVLGRKSKTMSSTIHSMIYNVKPNPKTGEVVFNLKENSISDFCVFIIDEASMIASKRHKEEGNLFISKEALLTDLIHFVKRGNAHNKIIFLGDKNQLPPVGELDSMALSREYLEAKFQLKGSAHLLTKVKRQEDGSIILKYATKIRKGIDKNLGEVKMRGFQKITVAKAASAYIKSCTEFGFENTISIGASHEMNKMFNGVIREKLYRYSTKQIELNELLIVTTTWRRNDFQLYSGDNVTVIKADYKDIETVAGLHFLPVQLRSRSINGSEELIDDYILLESISNPKGLCPQQENLLRFERFKKNKIYQKTGNPSDDRYIGAIRATYGYSITCNKAQGGEWDNVFLNTYRTPSLKFQYTAVTRAKSNLILY